MELASYANVAYPLHKASRDGIEEELLALLESGQCDVNCGSFDLVRPLHEASLKGHLQCVRLLLDYGAQVNICNIDGSTPLCDASSAGNVDIVRLLLQRGALVNPPMTLSSPVHEAVLYNRWECAEVLLAHNANPNVSDCHYGYPLHAAAVRGHQKCVEVLLCYGANVNAVHIHSTALHIASKRLDETMVRLLLEHGASVYAEDNHGRTPRDIVPAGEDGSKALTNLLFQWERTPKSLSHFCRLAIRNRLGNKGLRLIQTLQLPVPQLVKDFLQFRPQKIYINQ